jgi:osmotically-inducible protein OsmY
MHLSQNIARVFLFILPFTAIIAGSLMHARADSQTALMNRVNKAFRRDNRLNGAYCYTVAPGVVVLHGTVFDTADRELAESTARQVRGVKQVINSL